MRGKPACRVKLDPLPRLIPAHAGKTRFCAPQARSAGAHPRSCEENAWSAHSFRNVSGSSPLTRENVRAHRNERTERGSSPLTRGKRSGDRVRQLVPGLIPTHAGKTCASRRGFLFSRAHPRSCGEKSPCSASYFAPWGSSPLMRGKPSASSTGAPLAGLIPAHAGKTARRRRTLRSRRAHSRSCGDNFRDTPMPALWSGSSPLTRGKRLGGLRRVPGVGLIPTHAGKTPDAPSETFVNAGSSPLTRGKR